MRGFLMNRMLVVTFHCRLVRELHHHADIKRIVHIRTLGRKGLPDRKEFYLGNLPRERVRCSHNFLSLFRIAWLFQPDEADVIDFPGGCRLGSRRTAGKKRRERKNDNCERQPI